MQKLALHLQILLAMALGIGYAFLAIAFGWGDFTHNWIDPFGDIFIRLLKFIAVPLVLFSIITGVASLPGPGQLGRLGLKSLIAYVSTTMLAVGLGILLCNVFQPGKAVGEEQLTRNRLSYELWAVDSQQGQLLDDTRLLDDSQHQDVVASLRAQNPDSMLLVNNGLPSAEAIAAAKSRRPLDFFVEMVPENIFQSFTNMKLLLQVIFFAIFMGMALLFIPKKDAAPFLAFSQSPNADYLWMVTVIMRAAPFFVFALLAGALVPMADSLSGLWALLGSLLAFSLVAFAGLVILTYLIYPALVHAFVKRFTFSSYLKGIIPAQTMAFSTSSSAATLPVTMQVTTDNLGVPKPIANFILPIGSTVNMDGTSIYQTTCVLFLAQLHGIELSLGQQLSMILLITLSSIGSAAVPSGGLVMLMVVLETIGLNPAWIAIILPMDRLLDMCRTVVNITGDITVTTLIAETED